MRRRLRQQQRVREALVLDLGALVYELHRLGRREPELLQAKATELTAVDREVRALAEALDAGPEAFQLIAAGIVGSCASCGALLTSNDRYCSTCGTPVSEALPGDGANRGHEGGTGEYAALGAAPDPHGDQPSEDVGMPAQLEDDEDVAPAGTGEDVRPAEELIPAAPDEEGVTTEQDVWAPPAAQPEPQPPPAPARPAPPASARLSLQRRLRRGRDWLRERSR